MDTNFHVNLHIQSEVGQPDTEEVKRRLRVVAKKSPKYLREIKGGGGQISDFIFKFLDFF
jgi:hypothetical protein